MEIDRIAQRIGLGLPRQVDMGDLAQGMDAGIGAAGGGEAWPLRRKGEDRLLDRLLARRALGLALPADIAGAVVLDEKAKPGHLSSVPGASLKPRRNSADPRAVLPGRCK